MFSKGQVIFGIIFAIVFISIIVYTYIKDKKIHFVYYKKSYKTLIGFVFFIILLFLIKIFIKK
jgi:cbb3-type cytochrome oxidase subunit 3